MARAGRKEPPGAVLVDLTVEVQASHWHIGTLAKQELSVCLYAALFVSYLSVRYFKNESTARVNG